MSSPADELTSLATALGTLHLEKLSPAALQKWKQIANAAGSLSRSNNTTADGRWKLASRWRIQRVLDYIDEATNQQAEGSGGAQQKEELMKALEPIEETLKLWIEFHKKLDRFDEVLERFMKKVEGI